MDHDDRLAAEPMSVGAWVFTIFVLSIPVVNIIACVLWAASSTGNPNRKNFCIAILILFCIFLVLGIVLGVYDDLAAAAS